MTFDFTNADKYKYVCIYHRVDMDGRCAGAIINKYIHCEYKKSCYFIGLNYEKDINLSQIKEKFVQLKTIFVVDYHISPEESKYFIENGINVVILDHHKTFFDKYINHGLFECKPLSNTSELSNYVETKIKVLTYKNTNKNQGTFISWYSEKFSGALLTAYYVKEITNNGKNFLELKAEDRLNVTGMILIAQIVSVYDTWDHTDIELWNEAYWFNLACQNENYYPTHTEWDKIFYNGKRSEELISIGKILANYIEKVNATLSKSLAGTLYWQSKCFCAINGSGNSTLVNSIFNPELHDAVLIYHWVPKEHMWKISMYHNDKMTEKQKKKIDLSIIAKEFGGGGHKGACGFSCKHLPFDLEDIEPLSNTTKNN